MLFPGITPENSRKISPGAVKVLPVIFMILSLSACLGGGGGGGGGGSTADNTPPTATVNPADKILEADTGGGAGTPIVITFNESMNINSNWSVTGELAAESDTGSWTDNKTLTILSTSVWTPGTSRTLIIDAEDQKGNALTTLTLKFDIFNDIYYVDNATGTTAGDDAADGLTPGTAKLTILDAINDAALATTPNAVLVNVGTYNVINTGGDSRIELSEGVSLYGGYSEDFSERNPVNFVTTIADTSDTNATPNYAMLSNTAVTSATVVDGFTIIGSKQAPTDTSGIRLESSASPTIKNNIIDGGNGTANSYGIYIDVAAPDIYNNLIYGGGTGTTSYGIFINNTTTFTVRNNTIHGGTGVTNSVGMAMTNISGTNPPAHIDNNIILASTAATDSWCIHEDPNTTFANTKLESFRNNNLFSCDVPYEVAFADVKCTLNLDGDGDSNTCGIDDINSNSLSDINNKSGNVSADPQFADIDGPNNDFNMAEVDWHFSGGSPASVTAGGLNGIDEGWSFTTDKDSVTRPASLTPWSIGAYEP